MMRVNRITREVESAALATCLEWHVALLARVRRDAEGGKPAMRMRYFAKCESSVMCTGISSLTLGT